MDVEIPIDDSDGIFSIKSIIILIFFGFFGYAYSTREVKVDNDEIDLSTMSKKDLMEHQKLEKIIQQKKAELEKLEQQAKRFHKTSN
ncbi:CLUMA_CG002562, isoform A [Clunio marinus]|uniref:CLUMA_CG002562, isoform A n=1 Tax=Clunio marinus TaxID=568069 RepID=A0A1J1HME2_9DIPT|nr:CLUMA_CG002562, isoform A [Clunio marinus]